MKIECVHCGEVREVHVTRGWDIEDVQHTCPKRPRFENPGKAPDWTFKFNPRRGFF